MTLSPASLNITALARTVARLTKGQRVRVTFTDGVVAVGTLRGASILDPDSQRLTLDSPDSYRRIRRADGTPGPGIVSIEDWDDDAIFEAMSEDFQLWLALAQDANTCPRSEQEWRREKADEARQAIVDTWIRDTSWTQGLAR